MGSDSVSRLAKDWFKYKSLQVASHNSGKNKIWAIAWYPIFSSMVNLLFLISILGVVLFIGFSKIKRQVGLLLITTVSMWLINIAFSAFASPIVLRYQVFPISLAFCLAIIMAEMAYRTLVISEKDAKLGTHSKPQKPS
jgi:hypothetical protein